MAMPWHPCAAVALDPLLVPASQRLAWLLATSPEPSLRNGPEAVALAKRVGHATGDREAVLLDTLAAACAEAGQYERTAEVAGRAAAVARRSTTARACGGHRRTPGTLSGGPALSRAGTAAIDLLRGV